MPTAERVDEGRGRPAGRRALAAARREERESDTLLGAVDGYEHFRRQLIALIAAATSTTED